MLSPQSVEDARFFMGKPLRSRDRGIRAPRLHLWLSSPNREPSHRGPP